MNLGRVVIREILHRWLSFALGVSAVAFAVVCFVNALALLKGFDRETQRQLSAHEDDIRKTMKGLGFNIHIYPEDQDLAEVYARGFGSKTMPESYVTTLANSPIVTVNHLLPRLTEMILWPERDRTVLLFGVRGEEPIKERSMKKALIDPVQPGMIVLGYELHQGTELKVGDKVSLRGREFEISEMHERRGGVDDITAWISLAEAQEILDKEGRINSILALECNCASLDRLGEIESEIKGILPGTEIIEVKSKALARAKARNQAEALREDQRGTLTLFAGILVPLVALLCLGWILYLMLGNVRERTVEIGTLRAIGVGARKVFAVFLSRAFLMGLVGALLALMALFVQGVIAGENLLAASGMSSSGWAGLLLAAPLLACAAAWLPSLLAAERDPALMLRHD